MCGPTDCPNDPLFSSLFLSNLHLGRTTVPCTDDYFGGVFSQASIVSLVNTSSPLFRDPSGEKMISFFGFVRFMVTAVLFSFFTFIDKDEVRQFSMVLYDPRFFLPPGIVTPQSSPFPPVLPFLFGRSLGNVMFPSMLVTPFFVSLHLTIFAKP